MLSFFYLWVRSYHHLFARAAIGYFQLQAVMLPGCAAGSSLCLSCYSGSPLLMILRFKLLHFVVLKSYLIVRLILATQAFTLGVMIQQIMHLFR